MMDAKSAYNAILDRRWIHRMEKVTYTLHQVFRSRAADEVGVAEI